MTTTQHTSRPSRNGTTPNGQHLAQHHLTMLARDSAIDIDVINERGYCTELDPAELKKLGFAGDQLITPTLILPVCGVSGQIAAYQHRPDAPRTGKRGKPIKYETPAGARMVLDVHPRVQPYIGDPDVPLIITEGIKKADAAISQGRYAIALLGVSSWRGTNSYGGVTALADWNSIALKGQRNGHGFSRTVGIAFDSDTMQKPDVLYQLLALGDFLASHGADVSAIILEPGPGGAKVGLDDFFANGGTAADLTRLAKPLDMVAKRARNTIKHATAQNILDVLAYLGYRSFRFNEATNAVEVNGEQINEGMAARIRSDMADCGYMHMKRIEDAYFAAAFENSYHPVRDYLNGLVWDGKPAIATLANYFEDDHEPIYDETSGEQVSLFHLYLRRWLIGAVAKVFERAQNPMLALDGEQDLGKSAFAAYLASGLPDFFCEGPIDPHDKDHRLRLAQFWLWEIAELDATTQRQDVSALKSFITTKEVNERPAYGRLTTRRAAICSLIGTINDSGSGFLHDQTGNRRFLAVTLTKIDWDYAKLDVNQIWAEAVALYRNGFPWRLLPDEQARQREENKRYEPDDPIEAKLLKYCEIDKTHAVKGDMDWFTLSVTLLELLEPRRGATSKPLSMTLSVTAKKMGLLKGRETINGKQQPGYFGIRLAAADDDNALFGRV